MKVPKSAKLFQKLVVVALIRDGNGRVLIQRRRDLKMREADGKWEFPGGHIDFGETTIEAVRREVKEETGCDVSVGRLLPVVPSSIWDRNDGVRLQVFVLCYEAWHTSGVAGPRDPYVSEVRWSTPEEIAALDCLEAVPLFMEASEKDV